MKKNKLFALGCAGIMALGLLAGCGGNGNGGGTTGEKTTITINGSTSVEKLAISLSDQFAEQDGTVTFEITAPGSGAGIKAAQDGTADIGMSSRELKEEEKTLHETQIATDAIAVIINNNNPVTDLTSEQITQIFKGEIKNWKDVGGPDKEILLVCREAGSGTRDAFEEIMSLSEDGKSLINESTAIFVDATNPVAQNVQDKEEDIGYISLGSLTDQVKAVKVDGVEATEPNAQNGTYKIIRPFLLLTSEEPSGKVKEFMDYILSDAGQEQVVEAGFVPVN